MLIIKLTPLKCLSKKLKLYTLSVPLFVDALDCKLERVNITLKCNVYSNCLNTKLDIDIDDYEVSLFNGKLVMEDVDTILRLIKDAKNKQNK
jgi:hypothetical protein